MSTYSQDSNKSNRSINAKSQHSPLDKRNDQRNPSTGNAGKSTIIKPSQQPNQTCKINPNDKSNQQKGGSHDQWKAGASDNCGSTGRNA